MAASAAGEREGDPAALVAAYERLREAVLFGRPDGWRLGHGLLAGRGMVAWMAAFGALAPPAGQAGGVGAEASAPSPAGARPAAPTAGLVSLPGAEVVAVLAQMALAHAA